VEHQYQQKRKLIKDNREYVYCKFIENTIDIKVNPTDDLWTEEFNIKSYKIERGLKPQEIKDIQPTESIEFDWKYEATSHTDDLGGIARKLDSKFELNSIVWNIQTVSNNIIAANSNGRITIHGIDNNRTNTIQIRDDGDCVQLFHNTTNDKVIVNTSFTGVDEKDCNIAYEVDLVEHTKKEKAKGNFSHSKTKENKPTKTNFRSFAQQLEI